jgi:hypothetical protein
LDVTLAGRPTGVVIQAAVLAAVIVAATGPRAAAGTLGTAAALVVSATGASAPLVRLARDPKALDAIAQSQTNVGATMGTGLLVAIAAALIVAGLRRLASVPFSRRSAETGS